MVDKDKILKIAIPSGGALQADTLELLLNAGLEVQRTNARRYMGTIANLENTMVMFQRNADITSKVEEGSADLGILGYDRYLELYQDTFPTTLLIESLGFGDCALSIGIPDSWIDVDNIGDLADLASDFRKSGDNIRIATKFPRLVEKFFLSKGIAHFSIVQSSGTLEVAPEMGFADIIVDVTATGTTMRENHLKIISGWVIMDSQACLIGNSDTIFANSVKEKSYEMFVSKIKVYLNNI